MAFPSRSLSPSSELEAELSSVADQSSMSTSSRPARIKLRTFFSLSYRRSVWSVVVVVGVEDDFRGVAVDFALGVLAASV